MNQTYLLIGGNLGNREQNLRRAIESIATKLGTVVQASSIYETEAWGMQDQPAFLNQVLLVETKLDPLQLLQTILSIEEEMGRKRKEKFGPRIIDIDILFFGNMVTNQTDLTIPHPQLHLRRFTLEPLNEIASGYVHPVLQKTISELLAESADPLVVKKF
jgi:2-amino-4-hydroxy-6-hydroxymethyldihydropteridine diphosphokinase